MFSKLRRINNICLFLLISCVASAQSNLPFHFNEYGLSNGLSSVYSTFYLKDSRGFVWISSTEGLNRFDGQRAKVYKNIPTDSTSLYDNNIQSPFFEDNKGDIWFCTSFALHCYRRATDNFERIWIADNNNQRIPSDIYAFDLDTEGYLWLRIGSWRANSRLYKLNTNKRDKNGQYEYQNVSDFNGLRTAKTEIDKITNSYSIYSYPSKSGFGFTEYVRIKNEDPKLESNNFTGLKNDFFNDKFKISAVLSQDPNNLWLATDKGLVSLNKKQKTFKIFDKFNATLINNLLNAVEWRDDKIIVSTDNEGILFFDKKSQSFYQQIKKDNIEDNGLCSNVFKGLHIDKEENLWLFSWANSCINHINLKKFRFSTIELDDKNINKNFRDLIEDDDKNIWVANTNGELLIFNKQHQIIDTLGASIFTEKRIRRLVKDKKGNIWIFTDHKLCVFDRISKSFKTVIPNSSSNIYHLVFLEDGKILMVKADGVYEIKEQNGNYDISQTSLIPPQYQTGITKLFSISPNILFAPTKNLNVEVFKTVSSTWEHKMTIPVNDEIESYLQVNDTIWLGGEKNLWKIFPSSDGKYSFQLELALPFIYSIKKDDKNNLWIASETGLYVYNPISKKLKKFSTSDGISNIMIGRLITASSGEMLLTSLNKINVFRPEDIKEYDNKPIMQITVIKVNDEVYKKEGEVSELKGLTLDHTQNTVELEFVAIEYGDSKGNKLKFRLDNYDADNTWIEIDNIKPNIKYYKLPPGDYTFHLKGYNSDGLESEVEKIFTISIIPPWYQTWGGRILIALLLGLVIYGLFLWRLSILKQREEFKQKILKTEMKALRAQMDPHFLYNTMNSINAFILQNDRNKASSFLTDFAHLIRKILDFSKEETISIEKEEEILRGYLQMEAMRFSDSFDYEITIDDKLDPWDTQVPTMILQPFIENSIIHGIRNKKDGRGKISIRFEADGNDYFKCILEDNGVGRAKAAEINKQHRSKDHNSKGMQITNDRIEVLNHQRTKKSSLTIEDLKDDAGEAKGTKVIIRVPFF